MDTKKDMRDMYEKVFKTKLHACTALSIIYFNDSLNNRRALKCPTPRLILSVSALEKIL
jgi:hypothetical protein